MMYVIWLYSLFIVQDVNVRHYLHKIILTVNVHICLVVEMYIKYIHSYQYCSKRAHASCGLTLKAHIW